MLRAIHKSAYDGEGDAADAVRDFDVMSVAMKPYFMPDTTALDEQMRDFLESGVRISRLSSMNTARCAG